MGNKSKFLECLYSILENVNYHECIHWILNGTAFQITDEYRFQSEILPQYYETQKIKSFYRQLSCYGFKIKMGSKKHRQFSHQYFLKNQRECISLIKRKKQVKLIDIKYSKHKEMEDLMKNLKVISDQQVIMHRKIQVTQKIFMISCRMIQSIIDLCVDEIRRDLEGQFYNFIDAMIAIISNFSTDSFGYDTEDLKDIFSYPQTPNFSPLLFHFK